MTKHDVDRADRIVEYISWHQSALGTPPTVRAIGAFVGLASTSATHYHLRKLAKADRIVWTGRGYGVPQSEPSELTTERLELAWCLSVHGARPPKKRPCRLHRTMAEWLVQVVIPRAEALP